MEVDKESLNLNALKGDELAAKIGGKSLTTIWVLNTS